MHPIAPDWYRDRRAPYAVAIAGVKPAAGPSPLRAAGRLRAAARRRWRRASALRFAGRFVAGSLAGVAFVPIGAALTLRARLASGG